MLRIFIALVVMKGEEEQKSSWRLRFRSLLGSSWLLALLALSELVLGFVLLSFPYLLAASVTWVIGFVLCVAGLFTWVEVYRSKRLARGIYAGLAYLVVGASMLAYPVIALNVWTLILGVLLLLAGVMRMGIAYGMRGTRGSAWRFLNASVALALGALVSFSWPSSSLWFLGTVIAVEMIFSGWTMLFLVISSDLLPNTHNTQ